MESKMTPLQALEITESRIILNGLHTTEQAREFLDKEILRLRKAGNWILPASYKGKIINEEYDRIAREECYQNNATVRAVADFFKAHSGRMKSAKETRETLPVDGLLDIPLQLVAKVRTRLSTFEIEGIHPWEAVARIPQLEKQGSSKRTLQAIERLSIIARNVTEILLQKISKKTRSDGLGWKERISWCETPEDFSNFFRACGIGNIQRLYFDQKGLYHAITKDKRFGSWSVFLKFMGIEIQEKWTEKIAKAKSKRDFLRIFQENGLTAERWQSARWLQKNGFSGLYCAIVGCGEFDNWKAFLKFMDVETQDSWVEIVSACEKRKDFLRLFSEHDIQDWRSSASEHWEGKRGLYSAIYNDERFGNWTKFLEFMGIEVTESWVSKVEKCETREEFLKLFRENNIPDESWQESGKWLVNNGFGGLYQAICCDDRFKKWSGFLAFMGLELKEPWTERIKKCRTKKDFRNLFKEEGIADTWKSTQWLAKNGYYGLYGAIVKDERFGNWTVFLEFMGEKVAETARVRACKTRSDFEKLFTACEIKGNEWRNGNLLRRQGHDGLYQAITKGDERFGSWIRFIVCMDGHLPINGIKSEQQARQLLKEEILRLKSAGEWISSDSDNEVTQRDYDEIARKEYYEKNIIVRTVADYLRAKSKQKKKPSP